MLSIENIMNQQYYTTETIRQLTDSIASMVENDDPAIGSVLHFLTAAAHASDICETICNNGDEDFNLMPCENIEQKAASAFKYWRLRELFCQEDEQGNATPKPVMMFGNITAVPEKSEKPKGQSQLVKKASCFFLFYFWNLFRSKLGERYSLEFSINSVLIPMIHSYAFAQLGITIKDSDSAVQHYFDALKFGESVSGMNESLIFLAVKDMLNSIGIAELAVPSAQKYDESRFKVYNDELIKYIPSGNDSRVSVPEGIRSIAGGAFSNIAGITAVDLPDSLEELKPCALGHMPDLTEVNISHDLKKAGSFQFLNSKIELECNDMLIIGGWLFKCVIDTDVIKIPDEVVGICCGAFYESEKTAKEIILPSGIKEIFDEMFSDFTELEKINLPDGLHTIYQGAFNNCVSLKEIIMPDTVVTLDQGTFQGCESLVRVRLSDNITDLRECTFVDCYALEDLHLPEQLRTIGKYGINTFAGCSSLKKIVFPEHLEYIGECAFQDCEELEEIILPDSIREIDNMAFAGCSKLKTVRLPEREIEIAENAFEGTIYEAGYDIT